MDEDDGGPTIRWRGSARNEHRGVQADTIVHLNKRRLFDSGALAERERCDQRSCQKRPADLHSPSWAA